jgi:SprB repeat
MKKKLLLILCWLFFAHQVIHSQTTCPNGTLTATVSTVESRCTATGIINIIASGGLAPINYQYSVTAGPVTTPFTSASSLTGFPPGTYTVTVKDATRNCIINIPNVIVTGSYVAPFPIYSSTSITCMNGNNGTISLATLTGGNDPFTYTIISPSSANIGTTNNNGFFTGLIPGVYRIQLRDSCGAIQTRDMSVGSYSWSIRNTTTITKPTCQNLAINVALTNSNAQNSPNAVYNGFQYGIVVPPSTDTTWGTSNTFNYFIGLHRNATIVVKDNCGTVLKLPWNDPKPTVAASVTKSNLACNTFTAAITSQTNITAASTTYCLYDAANINPIPAFPCQSSPTFNNLPYGRYNIRTIDACYDTTIVRARFTS